MTSPAWGAFCNGVIAAVVVTAAGLAGRGEAAEVTRPILKTYFETGDVPTEDQFVDLIDSFLTAALGYGNSAAEHAMRLDNGSIALDIQNKVRALSVGDTVDDLDTFSGVGDEVQFNPLATGGPSDYAVGMKFQLMGATHFGFLQMYQDPPGSSTPYAIHLRHFVYEDTPGAPISVFFQSIPEPGTIGLAAAVALAALLRRRRGE